MRILHLQTTRLRLYSKLQLGGQYLTEPTVRPSSNQSIHFIYSFLSRINANFNSKSNSARLALFHKHKSNFTHFLPTLPTPTLHPLPTLTHPPTYPLTHPPSHLFTHSLHPLIPYTHPSTHSSTHPLNSFYTHSFNIHSLNIHSSTHSTLTPLIPIHTYICIYVKYPKNPRKKNPWKRMNEGSE